MDWEEGDLLIEEADEAELLHSSDDDARAVYSDDEGGSDDELSEKEETEESANVVRACPPPPAPSPVPFEVTDAVAKDSEEPTNNDNAASGTLDTQEAEDGSSMSAVAVKTGGMANLMFEEISKFLTAWTCDFPASLGGKRRRPRTSYTPPTRRPKRAHVLSKLPAMSAPDSNLDDYDELSRKALDAKIAHEAVLFAAQQAALEKRRQAREERKQRKRAQRQAQLEKQRTARLARAVKMNASRMQRRLNEGDTFAAKAPASSTYMDERDPSDYGNPETRMAKTERALQVLLVPETLVDLGFWMLGRGAVKGARP